MYAHYFMPSWSFMSDASCYQWDQGPAGRNIQGHGTAMLVTIKIASMVIFSSQLSRPVNLLQWEYHCMEGIYNEETGRSGGREISPWYTRLWHWGLGTWSWLGSSSKMLEVGPRKHSESLWIQCQDEDWYIPGDWTCQGIVCPMVKCPRWVSE